jgi:hypothetical protein
MLISSRVMGQRRVGGRGTHRRIALSITAMPTACTATVTATRATATRTNESIGREWRGASVEASPRPCYVDPLLSCSLFITDR